MDILILIVIILILVSLAVWSRAKGYQHVREAAQRYYPKQSKKFAVWYVVIIALIIVVGIVITIASHQR